MPGKGSRAAGIGALLVGVYDDHGVLRYAGRVGTGFTEQELDRLAKLLDPARAPRAPRSQPAGPGPRVTPSSASRELVAEVEFSEWTAAGSLRHPSYKGLREDKAAEEVVREDPPEEPAAHDHDDAPLVPEDARESVSVTVDGRELKLSNLEKVLYPQTGFTKREVIDYYAAIAPVLLPHLRDRPLTVKRWPDGVEGKSFFQKQAPAHRPDWVPDRDGARGAKADRLPARPGPADAGVACEPGGPRTAHAAGARRGDRAARPRWSSTSIQASRPRSSSAAGWRWPCAACSRPSASSASPRPRGQRACSCTCRSTRARSPSSTPRPSPRRWPSCSSAPSPMLVVSSMTKARRTGKVLIDWSQNDHRKTTVCVYSLRAVPHPTVSTPVEWAEVSATLDSRDPNALVFEASRVLERVAERGDLFAPVLSLVQELPAPPG